MQLISDGDDDLCSNRFRPQYRWVSNTTQSLDIDLSNEEKKKRLFNRLLYRSKQRGFLELDLVLGKWVEEHIHSMDKNGIKALVDVLNLVITFYFFPPLFMRQLYVNFFTIDFSYARNDLEISLDKSS